MSHEPTILYDDFDHRCFLFDQLVTGEGVESNQFLILHEGKAVLLDPGGDLTFEALSEGISEYCNISELDFIFASHQDPDIISSLDQWLLSTNCKVVTSRLWARFLPHLVNNSVRETIKSDVFDRIIAVPDEGINVPVGDTVIQCLPAHFLHSVGNLHFYDPISKILFSGDLGGSFGAGSGPVSNFSEHIPHMAGFHRRYMTGNKVCKLWAKMVRTLDVEMIVPQHGRYFNDKTVINEFLDWISDLQCGTDLLTEEDFRIPE
ncbi:oxygen-binding di-iron domain-containing protein [Alkalimarinus alittae]|uniref:MBL fold metallo-hydrolase n=1 Tax=Alkalimarinus alittae TaxID=2961619 RepID=A0ABY6N2B6_9ALTE|nr:MBL fold metallo-hydrolase [Alkalimarinus alittae]UZE96165.1 MBL fold metallo-hydrolase [Alkalimarinus alittae]